MSEINAKMLIDEEGIAFVPLSFLQAIFSSDGSKNLEILLAECVKSVNGTNPDENGNVNVDSAIKVLVATEENPVDLNDIKDVGLYYIVNNPSNNKAVLNADEIGYGSFLLQVSQISQATNDNIAQSIFRMDGIADHYATRRYTGNWSSWSEVGLRLQKDLNSDYYPATAGSVYKIKHNQVGESLLTDLNTTDKSSLVNAINEVLSSGGGGSSGTGYTLLEGTTDNPIDLNNITEKGIYLINTTYNTVKNLPTGANSFKYVFMIVEGLYGEYGPGFYNAILKQTIIADGGAKTNYIPSYQNINCRYFVNRSATSASWTSWNRYMAFVDTTQYFKRSLDMLYESTGSIDSYSIISALPVHQLIKQYIASTVESPTEVVKSQLSNLLTNDKTSLVNAINELNERLTALEGGTAE